MRLIEVECLENRAHNNQEIPDGALESVPDGWAVIPEDMVIPGTFPFVNIEVEDGVVTSMTAGEVPDPEPEEQLKPTILDQIEAQVTYTAMMTDTLLVEDMNHV